MINDVINVTINQNLLESWPNYSLPPCPKSNACWIPYLTIMYDDHINVMVSQITGKSIIYSTPCPTLYSTFFRLAIEKYQNLALLTPCEFPPQWTSTHWGRVTHICVSDLTSIGSDNGLSPGRRQAQGSHAVRILGKSRELSSVIPDREIVGNSIYFVLNSGKCVRRNFSLN